MRKSNRKRHHIVAILLFIVTTTFGGVSFADGDSPDRLQNPTDEAIASRYQTAPWKLLRLAEFRKAFDRALSPHRNVPAWVRRLDMVTLPTGVAYRTADGTAWAYEGTMPRNGDTTLRLVFIPSLNAVGLRLSQALEKPIYYGDMRASVRQILDRQTPFEYPHGNELKILNLKNPGDTK